MYEKKLFIHPFYTQLKNLILLVALVGFGTGHKVRGGGGWAGKICLSGDGFFVDPPLKKG